MSDPYSKEKKDLVFHDVPPDQVRDFHTRSDVDFSKSSQHHTLGTKPSQAAPGNHNHYNNNGVKLAQGAGLTLTGFKDNSVDDSAMTAEQIEDTLESLISLLKNVIEFTDNRTELGL